MSSLNWETEIYKKKKQINSYPYDSIVANTNRFFKNASKKKVLDLGCGTGNNTKFFIEYNFDKIYGIDISEKAIKIAKKFIGKNPKVNFIVKSFDKLILKDNYFDLICDRGSITHMQKEFSLSFFNNNAYKILKKGGFIFSWIFSSSHYASKKNSYYAFKKETKTKKGLLSSFFNKKEIESMFNKYKILTLIEEKKIDYKNNKKINATWFVVAKKL